jgi:hypothetical protein
MIPPDPIGQHHVDTPRPTAQHGKELWPHGSLQGVAGLLRLVGAIATWRQLWLSREGLITERERFT